MNKIMELLLEISPDSDFISSTDYINDHILDSFDVMTLIAELEERYKIKIQVNDIVPENFKNIESITDLVRKCGGMV